MIKPGIRTWIAIAALVASGLLYLLTDARYAALLVVVLVVLIVGAALIAGFAGDKITMGFKSPAQGKKGEPAKIGISMKNGSRLPIFRTSVDVSIKNLLTEESDHFKPSFAAGRGKSVEADFLLNEKHYGCVSFRADNVRISDPLGIFSKAPRSLKLEGNKGLGTISFLPNAYEMALKPEDLSTYDMESYKYSQVKKGNDPLETFDLKTYEYGDNIKAIHWKLSSKVGDIVIREHGLPIENRVMLIVDKRIPDEDIGFNLNRMDLMTELATSVSYTLFKQEIYHTVGWYDYINDEFKVCKVDSEDNFWLAVQGLISCPFRHDTLSSVEHFGASNVDKNFTNYIYLSDTGDDMERLTAYGEVDFYRPEDFN